MMLNQHDWAAVIGADLETGDPPVAYCCQACGRRIPGQILLYHPRDEAWARAWHSLPENRAAELQHAPALEPGAAWLADPRVMDAYPCVVQR